MEIDLELRWCAVLAGDRVAIDDTLFALLAGIARGGSLNFAAKAEGVSYRHAWGLIRNWEERLGAPLIVSRQGRGASLTTFGTGLLATRDQVENYLRAPLSTSALRASAAIDMAIESERRRVRIASSHDDVVLRLRESLELARREVSLETVGSEAALRQYRRGDADIAGFHLPLGELGRTVAAKLITSLDDRHDEIFLIEKRVLGLMSRSDKHCPALQSLVNHHVRFINRQAGSATRLTFDGLLAASGIAPAEIAGYQDVEYTHTAVAALVVSRDADAAFGSQSAARHFGLSFEPMVEERFYLAINREFDPAVRQYLVDFCAGLEFTDADSMKPDELKPSVAVLKRVHRAGFWKTPH
jgi:molybdate transport repressor ModE-like protein